MKIKKSFSKWLSVLTYQQKNKTAQMLTRRYSAVYWEAHPSAYVSMWMKKDFFNMDIIDFVAKYLVEMEDASTSEARARTIAGVILPMFRELTGKDYNDKSLIS